MTKRLATVVLCILFVFFVGTGNVIACDEVRTNEVVTQILFGEASVADENLTMLLNALYLCSEQADNQGVEKIIYLKSKHVRGLPSLNDLKIPNSVLINCSHTAWENTNEKFQKQQLARKKVLLNTINEVFDFGFFSNIFGRNSGKCNSFAELLYYSHILSDYLADITNETSVVVAGSKVEAYSGEAFIELKRKAPSFMVDEKDTTQSFYRYSQLDDLGRAGVAFANIGPENLAPPDSRQSIGNIKPSGWHQDKYEGKVNSSPPYLYNRCHLIAHQLGGIDSEENLITGTRYLNIDGMTQIEDEVTAYIKASGNHVLYCATPIYRHNNKLASGVQIEAYSVEDNGAGICKNIYCYNVQPGIELNYISGANSLADEIYNVTGALPFVTENNNIPNLITEVQKCLNQLFEDQKNELNANGSMMDELNNELDRIYDSAKDIISSNDKTEAKKYSELKKCEYELLDALKAYVPFMLKNETFFTSAFKN